MTSALESKLMDPYRPKTEAAPQPYCWTVEAYHRAGDAGVFGHEAKLELVSGRVIERFAESGPTDYHWTADAFDRACDAGVFEAPSRVELIQGRVIDRMGQSPLHSSLAAYFADCLRAALTPLLTVREEKPFRIAFDGEPVPDISVVTGRNLDYRQQHPTPQDVVLLVEIAVSTEASDLSEKALLYAQAGIADYWVALPEREQIVVHRDPTQEGYASVTALGMESAVAPLAASGAALSVRDLLGGETSA